MNGEPSIGIDLGTTNCAVATFHDGKLRLIERAGGQRLLPSMLGFNSEGKRVVGEEARLLSETSPENVAWATKRFIGRRWTAELAAEARTHFPYSLVAGPQEDVRIKVAGQVMPVVQISGALLSELRADAEAYFDAEVRRCVITVPAAFNDAQRKATEEAASIAGLQVMRLINEPTAAALAFGLSTGFTGNAVVFDLGGGTFDVSVLDIREGVFQVVATGGNPFLGGEDFDTVLVQWLLSHISEAPTRERFAKDPPTLQRLKAAAEQAKKAVSTTDSARIHLVLPDPGRSGKGQVIDTALTRDFFERLVRPKTELCINLVEQTLKEANVKPEQVGAVLMVGGMTRVPLIRQMVQERVGKLPGLEVNPDEAVAVGAAIHAAELASKMNKTLLLDVVGSTLSVGIAGGLVRPLIKKNSPLPVAITEIFHTTRAGQTVARLPVYQGEGTHTAENSKLGELKLEGLFKSVRAEIEVRFELSTNGTLSVAAKDLNTGVKESALIEAGSGLREEERSRLQKHEERQKDLLAPADASERHRNRHARRALHEVLVPLRRIHRELKIAAEETDDGKARQTAESLGQQLVEAESIETSGNRDQVVALATHMRDLLVKLVQAQQETNAS